MHIKMHSKHWNLARIPLLSYQTRTYFNKNAKPRLWEGSFWKLDYFRVSDFPLSTWTQFHGQEGFPLYSLIMHKINWICIIKAIAILWNCQKKISKRWEERVYGWKFHHPIYDISVSMFWSSCISPDSQVLNQNREYPIPKLTCRIAQVIW